MDTDKKVNDYNFTKDCLEFEKKHGKNKHYVMTKRQLWAYIPNWMRKWR